MGSKLRYEDDGNGGRLVVLSESEFKRLTSFATQAAELSADVRKLEQKLVELSKREDDLLPAKISSLIRQGDNLLQAVRKWRNLSQSTVAAQMTAAGFQMTQTTISSIETGRRPFTKEELRELASIYDVRPSWLVSG